MNVSRLVVIAAAASLGAIAVAQNNKPAIFDRDGYDGVNTPDQAVILFRHTGTHSMADHISKAEKHCKGRALKADMCLASDERLTGAGGERGPKAVCVVTCLVDEKRLVDVSVNPHDGAILAMQDTGSERPSHQGTAHPQSGRETTDNRPNAREQSGNRQGTTAVKVRQGDFMMAKRWQKSSDLIGKPVKNAQNEDLGRVEDIVVDAQSGRILYGVLSFGGFLGIGDKWFAIPWQSLNLSGDYRNFVLNVDKERLQNAQGFDKSQWPNFADERWATENYKYYNQTPYWQTSDSGARGTDGGDRTADRRNMRDDRPPYRERWMARPTVWQKVSDLTGKDIRSVRNEDLGDASDLIIDPDAGRVLYAVMQYNGRLWAIPFDALRLSGGAEHFVASINKDELKENMSFTRDNWPNVTDRTWAVEVHRAYHTEPYWDDDNRSDMDRDNRDKRDNRDDRNTRDRDDDRNKDKTDRDRDD